jgi:hypothetical protein
LFVDALKTYMPGAQPHVAAGRSMLAWRLVTIERPEMEQHPKLTREWALRCLERALGDLEDGPAERRVRRQFHQLLLAIEREAGDDRPPDMSLYSEAARVR